MHTHDEWQALIEAEIERRVWFELSHILNRSAGAIQYNLKRIRRRLSKEQFEEIRGEYDEIMREIRFQFDLAGRRVPISRPDRELSAR